MLVWTNDFLRRRRIKGQFNNTHSKIYKHTHGTPQGSILSLVLFILYLNGISQILPKDLHIAIYADDIILWYTSEILQHSTIIINDAWKM